MVYLNHPWGISTCPIIFTLSSINQLNQLELVPLDLPLFPIRPIRLLAHTVIASSDSYGVGTAYLFRFYRASARLYRRKLYT